MKYDRKILIDNTKILMKNNSISQAALANEISNRNIPLTQSRVSLCLDEKKGDNFTIEQIVAIADFFNVSVDALLGMPAQETHKELTGRDICKSIANIINCTDTAIGTCEDEIFHNYHSAIFFPKLEFLSASQKKHDINMHICKFLDRINDLMEMKRKGNLNKEMFDRLVESYLNDVPEEYYLSDMEIWNKYPDNNTVDDELPFPDDGS